MTVEETLKFAFDSMSGGTHESMMDHNESVTDDQKNLMSWMDSKYFKVTLVAWFLFARFSNRPSK